jgi:hypothetical protein
MKRLSAVFFCVLTAFVALFLFAQGQAPAPQGQPLGQQTQASTPQAQATAPQTQVPAQQAQPLAAQAQPLIFRNQIVFDPQGLGLEVFRMLVPKDWVFNGGITWNFAKNPPEAFVVYAVASPDGNSVIQQFPHLSMYWSPDQQLQYSYAQMGDTILQTMGAIDFLQRVFIPQARQGVSDIKVLETQPLPGVAQQALAISNLTLTLFYQISPAQSPYEMRADAGRVKVEYTFNGRRMIEDFGASITYFITNSPTLSGMYVPSIIWSPTVTSFRCPADEMPGKIRQFQIALFSRFNNPVWQVSYTRLCALVTREKLRQQQAIFARYQQIHKTLEECNDIIWQTYQNRSAAQDRMFDSYSQALRGVDTYVDPVNNMNIELPTGYDNAWTNGTDYVFSDNANFNPNVISTGNWQQMTRKR